MIFAKNLLLLLILSVQNIGATALPKNEPICYGQPDATKLYVYLHGLDSLKPGKKELGNRLRLRQLAKGSQTAVAIVRSQQECKRRGELRQCWPMQTQAIIEAEFNRLKTLAGKCAPKAKQWIWLGMSNGGYFIAKVFQACLLNKNDSLLMVGSAGSRLPWQAKSLADCGKAIVAIGNKDKYNLESSKQFYTLLKESGADVSLAIYDGGHDFLKAPIP